VRDEDRALLGRLLISPFVGALAILDDSFALLVLVDPGVVVWLRVIFCAC